MSKIEFEIDHLDPMGQGVDKSGDKVTFVPKTLPGEKGEAYIIKKSKGVQFARALQVCEISAEREEPECPHFYQCPGCHYLHTSYAHELDYKRQALARILKPLEVDPEKLDVIPAPHRLAYRNRIQLHYRQNTFGFIDAATDELVEVPECKIFEPVLRQHFEALYHKKNRPSGQPARGHVELYHDGHQVRESWNKSYAEGGFTQVNKAMNEQLKLKIEELAQVDSSSSILDLFSGVGNLSECFMKKGCHRTMIDVSPEKSGQDNYVQLNLYGAHTLHRFRNKHPDFEADVMLVDPPRKGFVHLQDWVKFVHPRQCIYVSCKAATLVRDLKNLPQTHEIDKVVLLDLFPGTHHFETVVSIQLKKDA